MPQVPATVSAPKPNPAASASAINETLANLALTLGKDTSGDYQVGPEDLLQITIFNVPESEGRLIPRTISLRVSNQGLISPPLIGNVNVAGLSLSQVEKELVKRYEKYIYSPQVGVMVSEYRQRVSVIGAVQKSGVFELSGPKTVIDVLAMAGGVTEKAGTQVHIYRRGENGRESHVIDLLQLTSNAELINANNAGLITLPVKTGDVINVPAAGTFFVDGAVKNPGPFPLGRRYSLTQALSTAGGVDRELYSPDITIFRRKNGGSMQPINVDFDAVLAGRTPDPQIEPDDVIVVPMSSAKFFVRRFVGQLIGGVSIGSFIGAS